MDRRERSGNPLVALQAAFEGQQAQLWTMLPCVVCTAPELPAALPFAPGRRTVTVQALIQVRVQQPTGDYLWLSIPPLVDVPVFFPGAGGVTITFPIKVGDEGLVIFSSRCIDAWFQNGGKDAGGAPTPQVQMEFRMHDLSDAMFFPGLNSLPHVIPAISTATAQFRSDTGQTFVEVDPHDGFVNITTPGSINATAGQSINARAGTDITADAGGNITAHADGNITATADGNIDATAHGEASVTATTSITLTAPVINLNGLVKVKGGIA
jgi:hypothetical protein